MTIERQDVRRELEGVAGALAELSVSRLTLIDADGRSRDLIARETDLPGELAAALEAASQHPTGQVRLEATDPAIRLVLRLRAGVLQVEPIEPTTPESAARLLRSR